MSLINLFRSNLVPFTSMANHVIHVNLANLRSVTRDDIANETIITWQETDDEGNHKTDIYELDIVSHNLLIAKIRGCSESVAAQQQKAETPEDHSKIIKCFHIFLETNEPDISRG